MAPTTFILPKESKKPPGFNFPLTFLYLKGDINISTPVVKGDEKGIFSSFVVEACVMEN
jgi:hypothetical protein